MMNTTGGIFPLGMGVVASAVGSVLVNRLAVVVIFGVDGAGVGVDGAGVGVTEVEDAVVPLVAVEIVVDEVFVVEAAGIVVFVTEVVGCELVVVDIFVVELNGVEVFAIEVVAVDLVDVEFARLIPSG